MHQRAASRFLQSPANCTDVKATVHAAGAAMID